MCCADVRDFVSSLCICHARNAGKYTKKGNGAVVGLCWVGDSACSAGWRRSYREAIDAMDRSTKRSLSRGGLGVLLVLTMIQEAAETPRTVVGEQ